MVSKNNYAEKTQKVDPRQDRFSIRKFTVGAASVLIGCTFLSMSNGQVVKADSNNGQGNRNNDDGQPVEKSNQAAPTPVKKVIVEQQSNADKTQASTSSNQSSSQVSQSSAESSAPASAASQSSSSKTTTFSPAKTQSSALTSAEIGESKAQSSNSNSNTSDSTKVTAPERDAERTLNLHYPDGKEAQATSYVGYYKETSISPNWILNPYNQNGDKYPSQDITVPGYTAKASGVNIVNSNNKSIFPETTAVVTNGIPQNSTYDVTYDPMNESRKVIFEDSNHNQIYVQTFTGKTGDDIQVSTDGRQGTKQLQIPAGWEPSGNSIIADVPLNDPEHNQPLIVTIQHQMVPIDPNKNKNDTRLVRNITRTIEVETPNGDSQKPFTTTQTATFWRTATQDAVYPHNITYGAWQAAKDTNGNALNKWNEYELGIDGYTAIAKDASGKVITLVKASDGRDALPSETLNENSQNQTITITYAANQQSFKINYIDNNDKKTVIHSQTVSGTTGQTVDVNLQVPTGYQLVAGQSYPSKVTFGTEPMKDTTLYVENSKVANSRTLTINYVDQDNNQNVGSQAVTGQVGQTVNVDLRVPQNYQLASGQQVLKSYQFSSDTTVAPVTIKVVRSDKQYTYTINYIDNDTKQNVGQQAVQGKAGQIVNVTLNVPNGYRVVAGTQVPSSITFGQENGSTNIPVENIAKVDARTFTINYVDNDTKQTVYTQTVKGQVGQSTNFSLNIPGGYEILHNGQSIPQSPITFGTNPLNPATIYVVKADKEYQYIINYADNTTGVAVGSPQVVKGKDGQTVNITLQVPTGYRVVGSYPASVTFAQKDSSTTVKVENIAQVDARQLVINYVDNDDNQTKNVGQQTIKGQVGQTVKVDYEVPKGYKILQNGQELFTSITFGQQQMAPQTIYVTDANKTYTYTINYVDNSNQATVGHQDVSGHYGDVENITLEVPKGYQAVGGQRVPSQITLTKNDSTKVLVEKTTTQGKVGDPTTITFQFEDEDDNNKAVDQPIVLNGKVGDQTAIIDWNHLNSSSPVQIPGNYHLAQDNQLYNFYSFTKPAQTYTIFLKHNQTAVNGDDHKNDRNYYRDITRTITNKLPNETPQVLTYHVAYERNGVQDAVTKKVTYGDWTPVYEDPDTHALITGFNAVTIPDAGGYQIQITDGKGNQLSSNVIPAVNVGPNDQNLTYTVNYAPVDQVFRINYVDNSDQTTVVSQQDITGQIGHTVPVQMKIPTGWTEVENQPIYQSFTFGSTAPTPVNVLIEHKIDQTSGGNDNHDQDVYRKVTRTINITQPGESAPQAGSQTLEYYRIKQYDEVTKHITYTPWTSMSVDSSNNKLNDYRPYSLPDHTSEGYVPQATENGQTLTIINNALPSEASVDSKGTPINRTITVTYVKSGTNPGGNTGGNTKPDQQVTVTIQYVDKNNAANIVGTPQNVTGTINTSKAIAWQGETGPNYVQLHIPVKWQLAAQNGEADVHFTENAAPIKILVEHKLTPVSGSTTNTDPQLYRKITQNITWNIPGEAQQTTHAIHYFVRGADRDEVTGHLVNLTAWNPASDSFPAIPVQALNGYTVAATKDGQAIAITNGQIAAQAITPDSKDENIVITYTKNNTNPGGNTHPTGTVTYTINYVDNSNSTVVGHQDITGKQGNVVNKITLNVPNGYTLVSGQNVPTQITLTKNDSTNLLVQKSEKPSHGETGTITFQFEDEDNNNQAVGTPKVLTGKIGDVTAKIDWNHLNATSPIQLPANYHLSTDNQLFDQYTFTDANPTYTILLKHNQETISGLDHHDNPDIYKQVTETVNITYPTGFHADNGQNTDQVKNSIEFYKTYKWDEVTNQMVAGSESNWLSHTDTNGDGKADTVFGTVHLPANITGYTAHVDNGQLDANGNLAPLSALKNGVPTDQIVNVTYTLTNPQGKINYTVRYVDNSDPTKVIGTHVFTGTTGQQVTETIDAPSNWTFVGQDGKAAKNQGTLQITFGPTAGSQDIRVMHNVITVSGLDHKDDGDLYKTATETINVTYPEGVKDANGNQVTSRSFKNVIEFYRTYQLDQVTNQRTYSNWLSNTDFNHDGKGDTDYPTFKPAVIEGYTPKADQGTITNGTLQSISALQNGVPTDVTVNVSYVKNGTNTGGNTHPTGTLTYTINYVDNSDKTTVVGHQDITGKYGDVKNITLNIPSGYELVKGENTPSQITLTKNDSTNVLVEKKSGTNTGGNTTTTINGHDHKDDTNFYRDITRTVTINTPNSQPTTNVYHVIYVRNGQRDAQGNITYDAWQADDTSKGSFPAVTVPAVAGYTTVITDQDGKTVNVVPALNVTPDTKNQAFTVNYKAAEQKFIINYINANDDSDLAGSQTITGTIGQTVNYTLNVPTNWKLADDSTATSGSYTFGSTAAQLIVIKVVHNTTQTTGGVDGDQAADVYQTVERTFVTHDLPNGDTANTGSQTLVFSRTKTVDAVTGKTTYTPWQVISRKNNEKVNEYSPYTGLPYYAGYVPVAEENGQPLSITINGQQITVQAEAAVDSKGNPINRKIDVTYVPTGSNQNPANNPDQTYSRSVNFVDNSDHDIVVGSQTVTGKNGATVQINLQVPEHWQVAQGSSVPTSVKIDPTNLASITVYVEHKTGTIKNAEEAQKSGNSDFYRLAQRTITIDDPQIETQSIPFFRTGSYDEVTGAATYTSKWAPVDGKTTEFAAYTIPGRKGYKATISINGGQTTDMQADKDGNYVIPAASAVNSLGAPITDAGQYVVEFVSTSGGNNGGNSGNNNNNNGNSGNNGNNSGNNNNNGGNQNNNGGNTNNGGNSDNQNNNGGNTNNGGNSGNQNNNSGTNNGTSGNTTNSGAGNNSTNNSTTGTNTNTNSSKSGTTNSGATPHEVPTPEAPSHHVSQHSSAHHVRRTAARHSSSGRGSGISKARAAEPRTVRTSARTTAGAAPSYAANNAPHGENGVTPSYANSNIAPESESSAGSAAANLAAQSGAEHIDENGNIVSANGQIIGYIDQNGKVHYTLPKTGQNSNNETAAAILGGVAATIGLIGLAGVKKKQQD